MLRCCWTRDEGLGTRRVWSLECGVAFLFTPHSTLHTLPYPLSPLPYPLFLEHRTLCLQRCDLLFDGRELRIDPRVRELAFGILHFSIGTLPAGTPASNTFTIAPNSRILPNITEHLSRIYEICLARVPAPSNLADVGVGILSSNS